jgi:hypothetical protein
LTCGWQFLRSSGGAFSRYFGGFRAGAPLA